MCIYTNIYTYVCLYVYVCVCAYVYLCVRQMSVEERLRMDGWIDR